MNSPVKALVSQRGRNWIALILITLLGSALRLYRIDYQSVWNDEAFSITVSALGFRALNERLVHEFMQPPLHYYLLHGWFAAVGFGALPARLLSAVFGALAILLLYFLAERLFDRGTGILAALLLAISQVGIVYSQEARPYAQFMLLSLLSAYLFLISLRRGSAWTWWAFVVSSTLLIYTHYFGLFWLVSLAAFGVLLRRRYPVPISRWAGGGAFISAAYLPWILSGAIGRGLQHHFVPMASFTPHWWSLLSAVNWFNNGKLFGIDAQASWWTFPAGSFLFTLPALLAFKPLVTDSGGSHAAGAESREGLWLLALLFILPMLLVFAVGYVEHRYSFRYVTVCSLPYYILVARGITTIRSSVLRRAATVSIVLYSTLSLRADYFIPYKEDYRGALEYVASEYRQGDCAVFAPNNRLSAAQMSWQVYHRGHPLRIAGPGELLSGRGQCGRVWLVRDTWFLETVVGARDEDPPKLDRSLLTMDERHYRGVEVALYVSPADPRVVNAAARDGIRNARRWLAGRGSRIRGDYANLSGASCLQ